MPPSGAPCFTLQYLDFLLRKSTYVCRRPLSLVVFRALLLESCILYTCYTPKNDDCMEMQLICFDYWNSFSLLINSKVSKSSMNYPRYFIHSKPQNCISTSLGYILFDKSSTLNNKSKFTYNIHRLLLPQHKCRE